MAVIPKECRDTVASPEQALTRNPKGALDIIAFACESDFAVTPQIENAIEKISEQIAHLTAEEKREGLERIIVSAKAGEGLKLLIKTDAVSGILGRELTEHMSRSQIDKLTVYMENVHKTHANRLRRLAVFFLCFDTKKAEKAILALEFPAEEQELLLDGIYLMEELYFLNNKYVLKKFMSKYGKERYEFLHNMSKAHRIIYDLPVNRVTSRDYLVENIRERNETIYEEDLAVSREDFKELGIGEEKDYDWLFGELLDLTYMIPKLNRRDILIDYGKKYSKHKWMAMFKKLRYIK